MKISVKVKPGASKEGIEELGPNQYQVWVHEPPEDGKANKAVTELLSEYFDVARSKVILKSGQKSKQKTFIIDLQKELFAFL